MRTSARAYEPHIDRYREHIKRYLGARHYPDTESIRVPVPLVNLLVTTFTNELVSNNPRVLVTAPRRELRPAAMELETTVNAVIQRIDLQSTIQRVVVNSLFHEGIACVGLADGYSAADGLNYGKYFIDNIDPPDYLIDMSCRVREDAQFESYAIEINAADAVRNELLSKKRAEELGEHWATGNGYYGRVIRSLASRIDQIEHFKDVLRLHVVWLPYEGMVLTVPSTDDGLPDFSVDPLVQADWRGPPRGPIHKLGYFAVPGSPIPLAPVSPLIDLADFCNKTYEKSEDQTLNQKTVFGADDSGIDGDTERIRSAEDLEIVSVRGGRPIDVLNTGGAHPGNVAMMQIAKDLFSYFAGNLDVMAGLAPQSETATQDAMLQSASGKRLAYMARQVYGVVAGMLGKEGLSHYVWHDPLIDERSTANIGGSQIQYRFTPERRKGTLDDYDIDIEPYSLQYRSPQQKLATVTSTMQNAIFPVLPFAQDQNVTFDLVEYLKMIGRLQNMESEYQNLFRFKDRSQIPNEQVEMKAPAFSQRNYTRRSVGGYRGSGRATANDQILKRFMAGAQ